MICLYFIRDEKSGKYYVGSTKEFNKRIDRHFRELKCGNHHCSPLQEVYNERSEMISVEFKIMETLKEARQKEQEILNTQYDNLFNISKHSTCGDLISYHPKRKEIIDKIKDSNNKRLNTMSKTELSEVYGLKGSSNGMYGKTHTDEVKSKLSERMKGNSLAKGYKWSDEQRANLSKIASKRTGETNPFYGKQHSEETKKLLSEKMKGRKPKNSRRVKVEGNIYESVTSASKELKVSPATIIHRIKSENVKYENYRYVD